MDFRTFWKIIFSYTISMNLMWKYVEKLQYFGKNWMLSGSKCFGGYFGLYFGGYKNEKLRTKIKYGNAVKLSNFTLNFQNINLVWFLAYHNTL